MKIPTFYVKFKFCGGIAKTRIPDSFSRDSSHEHRSAVARVSGGFWVDEGGDLTHSDDAKYWIAPSQIIHISKD